MIAPYILNTQGAKGKTLDVYFPPNLVAIFRYGMEEAYRLAAPVTLHYHFYNAKLAATVTREVVAVPSPEPQGHVALLTWHRGTAGIGAPSITLPPPPLLPPQPKGDLST